MELVTTFQNATYEIKIYRVGHSFVKVSRRKHLMFLMEGDDWKYNEDNIPVIFKEGSAFSDVVVVGKIPTQEDWEDAAKQALCLRMASLL